MRLWLALLVVASSGCLDFSRLKDCQSPWICENFESGSYDATQWSVVTQGTGAATGLVDSTLAHGGRYALSTTLSPSAGQTSAWALQWPGLTGSADASTFVRTFVKVTALPADPVQLIVLRTGDASSVAVHLYIDATSVRLTSDDGTVTHSTDPLPVGRWVCLEWNVKQGAQGGMTAWVDDAQVVEYRGNPGPGRTFTKVTFGAELFGAMAATTFEARFDDLVVAGQRIGCAALDGQ